MNEDSVTQVRWFVGIPVVTNPIIALDVAIACIIVWFGAAIVIAAAQQFIGTGLTRAAFMAAVMYASYLAGAMLAVFFVAGVFVLGNKYAALCRIDAQGVYVETMRASGVKGDFFRTAPFPIGPIHRPKSAPRAFSWKEISGYQKIDSMRTIILKGKRGTLVKLFCPDEKTFRAALAALRGRVGEK